MESVSLERTRDEVPFERDLTPALLATQGGCEKVTPSIGEEDYTCSDLTGLSNTYKELSS